MSKDATASLPKLKVETWPIDRLIPYARNPRKNDEVVGKMVAAIREFGFRIPVVAKSDGTIVDGHLRLKAAIKLGLKEIPVALADELTDAQVKAFRLLANQSANWAKWDNDLLKLELADLKAMDYDLALTGFDNRVLDEQFAGMTMNDKNPDDAPPLAEETISQKDDLWLLGAHRLLCGDSAAPASLASLMDGEKLDMVWMDPPYNVDYSSKNTALNAASQGNRIQTPIARDKMREGEFEDFLLSAFKNYFDALQSGGPIYVAYAAAQGKAFMSAFEKAGFTQQGILTWVKNNIVIGRYDYQQQSEPILYGWKPGAAHKWYGGRKERSVRLSDIPELTPTGDGSYQLALANRVVTLRGRDLVAEEIESDVLRFPEASFKSATSYHEASRAYRAHDYQLQPSGRTRRRFFRRLRLYAYRLREDWAQMPDDRTRSALLRRYHSPPAGFYGPKGGQRRDWQNFRRVMS